jgi:hypothetical protein
MSNKLKHEREVFDQFVRIAKLPVRPGSIRAGNPALMEPDIVADVDGQGSTGFELTRIAEHDFMKTRAAVARVDRALREALSNLPPDEKAVLQAKYGNADIAVWLSFEHSVREIEATFPKVFRLLQSFPDGYSGTWSATTAGILTDLDVHRISAPHGGPTIYAQHPGGWLGDVTIESIEKKLRRTYSASPARRELLAYYREEPPISDDVRRPAIREYLDGLEDLGPFDRLWVVNFWSGAIEETCERRVVEKGTATGRD